MFDAHLRSPPWHAGPEGAHSFKFQSVINTKIENVVSILRECDLLGRFDKNLDGQVLWRPNLFETAGKCLQHPQLG